MSTLPDVRLGNKDPLYNIGVVSRMTGVSMATLRAWERRYDFPESERTAGGHRLYSERDIFRLLWVKERIDSGMQTAQAINAIRYQEDLGHTVAIPSKITSLDEVYRSQATLMPVLHERLLMSLVECDLQAADVILGEALASSSPEDLIMDIIGPAIASIGAAWEHGSISVATEHLATNYLRQRLLMWMMSGPPPRAVNPIILACAPNEWHEGSLLILGALLRRRRWPVAYLGQAVPLPDLASFVREIRPSTLILVAMTEQSAIEIADWPQWLPEVAQTGKPIVSYGGRVFVEQPEWQLRIAGTYLGDNFRQAVKTIEELI